LVEKKAMADADGVDAGDLKVVAVRESIVAAIDGHHTSSLAIIDALDVPVEQQAAEDLVLTMADLAAPVQEQVVVEAVAATADDGHHSSSRAIVGALNVPVDQQAAEDLVPSMADLAAPKQGQDMVEAAVVDEV
jgi:hypothetical protein